MTDVYLDPRDQGILFVAPQSESDLRVPTAEELTAQSELMNRAIISSFPQGNNNKLTIRNEATPISDAEREIGLPVEMEVFLQGHPLVTFDNPYRITLPEVSSNPTDTLYMVGFFYEVTKEIDGLINFNFKYRDSDGNIQILTKENTRRIRSGWMLINTPSSFGRSEFVNELSPQTDSRKFTLTVPSHTTKSGWALSSQIQAYLGSLPIKDFNYTLFLDGIQVIPLLSLDRDVDDGSPDFSSVLISDVWASNNNTIQNGSLNNNQGTSNTIVGEQAGASISTGFENSIFGHKAGQSLTTSDSNTFIGTRSGQSGTTADANTFVGYESGQNITTGFDNTFVGYESGQNITTGSGNIFFGTRSGQSTTTAVGNTFVGYQSGENVTTAQFNTFIGFNSGQNTTTGGNNTFVGNQSGQSLTTGSSNTFFGTRSGENATTATNNIVIGTQAGSSLEDGSGNVFLGTQSGENATTGSSNTFVGAWSGQSGTTGIGNTFVGHQSGESVTTGFANTFVGSRSGISVTTANSNIFIGVDAGDTVTTGIGNIFLGDRTDSSLVGGNNQIVIGQDAEATVANEVVLGNASITHWRSGSDEVCDLGTSTNRFKDVYAVNGTIQTSALAEKSAIVPTSLGLDFINALNPVQFEWKNQADNLTHYGLILEEVQALGVEGITREAGIAYSELISPLIKAVQQLTTRVQELEEQLSQN